MVKVSDKKHMSKLDRVVDLFLPHRVFGYQSDSTEVPRGRILLSYLARPLTWKPGDRRYKGHTNRWESGEIGRIFCRMGYAVDAIDWDDLAFKSKEPYTGIFDIHMNLRRLSTPGAVKMMHLTGSNLAFSNSALQQRLDSLYGRRGVRLNPRRRMPEWQVEEFEQNFESADAISLIGNDITRSTYPRSVRDRIRLVPVTGSYLGSVRDPIDCEFKKEFLWFAGPGSVHKGLDLVLEVFSKLPDFVLHLVGTYDRESDFVSAYNRELYHMPNIKSHGYIDPSSAKFREVTRSVIGHIMPSCSEGISPAAVTCMQYGFVPILGVNVGIDLTPDIGRLLYDCSLSEIENAVKEIGSLDRKDIVEMVVKAQQHSKAHFSQEQFRTRMTEHISLAMGPAVHS